MQLKPTVVIAVLSLVVASLLVAGCTDTQETTQSNACGVAVAVNSVTTSSRIGSDPLFASTPHPGNHFITFNVTVTNVNKDDLTIGSYTDFTLTTKDGTVNSPFWRSLSDDALSSKAHTNPGEKVTGTITFEIPQNGGATALSYADGVNGVIRINL
jgi:hypothetical protein